MVNGDPKSVSVEIVWVMGSLSGRRLILTRWVDFRKSIERPKCPRNHFVLDFVFQLEFIAIYLVDYLVIRRGHESLEIRFGWAWRSWPVDSLSIEIGLEMVAVLLHALLSVNGPVKIFDIGLRTNGVLFAAISGMLSHDHGNRLLDLLVIWIIGRNIFFVIFLLADVTRKMFELFRDTSIRAVTFNSLPVFERIGFHDCGWDHLGGLAILRVDRLENAVRIILMTSNSLLCCAEFFLHWLEVLVTDVLLSLVLLLFIDAHVIPVMKVFIVLHFILILQELVVVRHLMVVHGSMIMMRWVELRIWSCLMM